MRWGGVSAGFQGNGEGDICQFPGERGYLPVSREKEGGGIWYRPVTRGKKGISASFRGKGEEVNISWFQGKSKVKGYFFGFQR